MAERLLHSAWPAGTAQSREPLGALCHRRASAADPRSLCTGVRLSSRPLQNRSLERDVLLGFRSGEGREWGTVPEDTQAVASQDGG